MLLVQSILKRLVTPILWFRKATLIKKIISIVVVIFIVWIINQRIGISKSRQLQFATSKVERGNIVSTVSVSGNVSVSNLMNLTTQASGLVKDVYVKDGDKVTVGQKIAEIALDQTGKQKNASAWSSYLSAKNTLEAARATQYSLQSDMFDKWDTFKTLAESATFQNSDGSPRYEQRAVADFHIAEKDWLAAEVKYKNQQAVIGQAQAALNSSWLTYQQTSSIITAPIGGTTSNVGLVEGMVLSIQIDSSNNQTNPQRVATIQNESNPLLTFNLTEIDVLKVKTAQKATITLDSLPNKSFTGKVVTVDRIGTTSNNVTNYPITIQLDTISLEIIPNMTANADIIIETKNNILLVPSAAIQTQDSESFVRVLKNGQARRVQVETGLFSDTQTEVISGLSEGDDVITGTVTGSQTQQSGGSIFGGGGAFRPGGFGAGRR